MRAADLPGGIRALSEAHDAVSSLLLGVGPRGFTEGDQSSE